MSNEKLTNEIMKAEIIYTWRTKKEGNQFRSVVVELSPRDTKNEKGSYCDSKNIDKASRLFNSRAKAKTYAQKYCRFLKATA